MANMKTNFEYHVPGTLRETLELLDRYGAACKVIAGGTDLIPKMKAGIAKFEHLISLKNVEELKHLSFEPEKGIHIGANVDLRTTEQDETVRQYYPALFQGMHSMANTQIRNRGTVAGNICNAVPSADTAPALLAYEAEVVIMSKAGKRVVPIGEFFTGVCRTVLKPEELVTEIFIPLPDREAYSIYTKYAIRKALDLAMIGVAVNVTLDADKVVRDAKIGLGAVAITPKRAPKAEALLLGQKLTEELIGQASETASREDCAPISDIRATADYRRRMVYVHVRDALRKAVNAS